MNLVPRSERTSAWLSFVLVTLIVLGAPLRAAVGPSTGLIPLTDLGSGNYKGSEGGLYPGGSNEIPSRHLEQGHSMASEITPRDATGRPSASGTVAVLGLGSTTAMLEYEWFQQKFSADKELNSYVKFVDGSAVGQSASAKNLGVPGLESDRYWAQVIARLREAGCTPQQVQVAWIEDSDVEARDAFPQNAKLLQQELAHIVQTLHQKCPNCQICYLSSHIYAGYATKTCSEPYAYETGFAVKWLIEQQIKGDPELNFDPQKGPPRAPWLAWGPYLWADGTKARKDGLTYVASDFRHEDQMHPDAGGMQKVAQLLSTFFKADQLASTWSVPGAVAVRDRIYAFDHSLLDQLLQTYVADGKVDYDALKAQGMGDLEKYLDSLANAEPDKLTTDTERLAFWLNAYNACSIKTSLDGNTLENRATRKKFFSDVRYQIAGHAMCLDDMEHQFMGPLFKQPKTHFGLVCSSNGCPVIRGGAYNGGNVTSSLDDSAREFINNPNRVHFDENAHILYLSQIFDWYKADFEHDGQTVDQFVRKYLPPETVAKMDAAHYETKYMDYDWSLNKAVKVAGDGGTPPQTAPPTEAPVPSPTPATNKPQTPPGVKKPGSHALAPDGGKVGNQ